MEYTFVVVFDQNLYSVQSSTTHRGNSNEYISGYYRPDFLLASPTANHQTPYLDFKAVSHQSIALPNNMVVMYSVHTV